MIPNEILVKIGNIYIQKNKFTDKTTQILYVKSKNTHNRQFVTSRI